MVIYQENKKQVDESSTNVRLRDKMEGILSIEYSDTVANISTGEIPMDKAAAIVVSMAIDAINEWVHRRRDAKGQYQLARYTSAKNTYQYDKSLDNKLYSMEHILMQAKAGIERFQK
ncbi:MAG: hypothetical protein LBH43_01045 [Treponema sp.]|jgi:hypothetical protein|nr:hypothetical protein [Treponema sp.]